MSTTTIRVSGGQTFVIPQVMTQQEVINTYASLQLGNMRCTESTGAEGSKTYDFSPQTGNKGSVNTTTVRVSGGQTFVIPQVMTQQEVINTYSSLQLGNMNCSRSVDGSGNVTFDFAPQTGNKGA